MRRQVVDTGTKASTVPAATNSVVSVLGTIWPLLPRQTIKIYNASAHWVPDNDLKFIIYSIWLALIFLDDKKNPITLPLGWGLDLTLGAWNSGGGGTPTTSILSDSGYSVGVNGDPLIELSSNILVANVPATGAGLAAVQLLTTIDLQNTDAAPQVMEGVLSAVLSFEQE